VTSRTAVSRLRDFFLFPAYATRPERVAPVPPVVVVLGDARAVAILACAAALELARGAGHDHAAVCLWPSACVPAIRLPASPAARRGARRAAARGCHADASGRLVRARLPDPPLEAAATAQRVAAAAECPVAIALAGARTEELDTLFCLGDAIVLARRPGDAPALTRLAESGLARLQVPVATCEAGMGAAARMLAVAGLGVAPAARAALVPLPLVA
jgi:hypothetical protein